jgi:hypothetical protein
LKQIAPSEKNDRRTEAETNSGNASKSADKKPAPKDPPKDYIHVRARRGQATDSHSLAERVSSHCFSWTFHPVLLDAFLIV